MSEPFSISSYITGKTYVCLLDLNTNEILSYEIVSQEKKTHYLRSYVSTYGGYNFASEQILEHGGNGIDKISLESPMGKAIIGKHAGDIIEYKNPAGTIERFQILELSKKEIRGYVDPTEKSDKKVLDKEDVEKEEKAKDKISNNTQRYSKTEIKEMAEYINSHLEMYLNGLGFDTKRHFRCLNPRHSDRTPSMMFYPNTNTVHCYGCGAHYDLISLIGFEYGLNDRKEAFRKACEIYNPDCSQRSPVQTIEKVKTVEDEERERQEYIQEVHEIGLFFEEAEKNIENTTYHRGLSLRTLKQFHIGYVEQWKHPKLIKEGKNPPSSPRIIVPVRENSYLARDTRNNLSEEQEQYKKMKYGPSYVFNHETLNCIGLAECPIFIVEGEFDAMSIYEAGARAVGLGSLSNIKLLLSLIDNCQEKAVYVIALDNEDKPQVKDAEKQIEDGLRMRGLKYIIANPAGEYKDANESLMNEPIQFFDRVFKIEQEAKTLISKADALHILTDKEQDVISSSSTVKKTVKKLHKEKFHLSYKQAETYKYRDKNSVSYIALEMNKLRDKSSVKAIQNEDILEYLMNEDLISIECSDNMKVAQITEKGLSMGIFCQHKVRNDGLEEDVIYYSENIQRMIVGNWTDRK